MTRVYARDIVLLCAFHPVSVAGSMQLQVNTADWTSAPHSKQPHHFDPSLHDSKLFKSQHQTNLKHHQYSTE